MTRKTVALLVLCVLLFVEAVQAADKIVYEKKVLIEAGSGSEPGQYGSSMEMDVWPVGPELDQEGNIYILDPVNDRIQKYDGDGKFLKVIPIKSYEWGYESRGGEEDVPYEVSKYRVQAFTVDKDGYIYVVESVSGVLLKYDQEGKEIGRAEKGYADEYNLDFDLPDTDLYGKPLFYTKDNKMAYMSLDKNGVHIITTIPIEGITPVMGNFYEEDYKKGNSYWIEDGTNEKEKKIVLRQDGKEIKSFIFNFPNINRVEYFHLVHVDKLGSLYITAGGSIPNTEGRGYDIVYNKEGLELSNGEDMPGFAFMEYTMDKDGNIYNFDFERFTLTKWERKYQ